MLMLRCHTDVTMSHNCYANAIQIN